MYWFSPWLCHWWLPPVPVDKGSFPASLTGSGSFAVAGGLGGATLWEEGVELEGAVCSELWKVGMPPCQNNI